MTAPWTRDEEKRARRAADVVAGSILSGTLHCDTCSAVACDGIGRASFDQLRLSHAVQEVYREAWERGFEAAEERWRPKCCHFHRDGGSRLCECDDDYDEPALDRHPEVTAPESPSAKRGAP